MNMKKMLGGGILLLAFAGLLVSVVALVPSRLMAEEMTTSDDQHNKNSDKKDPHARFREGSMMGMMEGMSPHSRKAENPHGAKKGKHSPFSAQGLKEKLGLDEDQTKKMRQLISNYRKESISKQAALKIAQIEFDEAVAEKGFSLSDVEKKVMQRESVASELTMVRVKALAGAREVLSDTQFEQFKGLMAHRMSRHGGKGKHRGGHKSGHGFSGEHGFSPHGGSSVHGGMTGHGSFSGHGKSGRFEGAHGGGSPHGRMSEAGSGGYDD